jgi:hypothetical protein
MKSKGIEIKRRAYKDDHITVPQLYICSVAHYSCMVIQSWLLLLSRWYVNVSVKADSLYTFLMVLWVLDPWNIVGGNRHGGSTFLWNTGIHLSGVTTQITKVEISFLFGVISQCCQKLHHIASNSRMRDELERIGHCLNGVVPQYSPSRTKRNITVRVVSVPATKQNEHILNMGPQNHYCYATHS